MITPATPPQQIILQGRPYTLDYSRASWVMAEVRLKMPLLSPGCDETWTGMGTMGQCAILLFVGLCRANPKLALDDVAVMLPDTPEGLERIAELAKASLPQPQEGEQSADPSTATTGS